MGNIGHAAHEAYELRELRKRASQGDKFAERQLRRKDNASAAGLGTFLLVATAGAAAGAAATVVGPAALGAGFIAKGVAYFNTK